MTIEITQTCDVCGNTRDPTPGSQGAVGQMAESDGWVQVDTTWYICDVCLKHISKALYTRLKDMDL